MFEYVIQVDEYIIQIYYDTNIQNIRNEIIYELLRPQKTAFRTQYESFE